MSAPFPTHRPYRRALGAVATLAFGADIANAASLRFFGNGANAPTLDRVAIRLDAPARPVDVGAGDFTIEFWLRALSGENTGTGPCSTGNDAWIYGRIVLDRDINGPGDYGDYGLALMNRRLAFGVSIGLSGATACGAGIVDDGVWHHVALTRRGSDGALRIWLDGQVDGGENGPIGDASYRDGRLTDMPYDPYLVVGAEKHDYPTTLSYAGWIDELRVSNSVRYAAAFVPRAAAFATDAATVALYHFDEGAGDTIGDASGASGGPSAGERRYGGTPAGPEWSSLSPFGSIFVDGFE